MNLFLAAHIVGGGLGIAGGAVALIAPKGEGVHRGSGAVFAVAMPTMAVAAVWLAVSLPDWANLPGGLFALYLVVTGWGAATRRAHVARWIVQIGLVLGGAVTATSLLLAAQANASASGLVGGKPALLFEIVAGLATFAIVLDLRLLHDAKASAKGRIARHIWRMCTALFLATGSFFLGQQKVMPAWMQGSPLLAVLAVAPLAAMGFWLIRTAMRRPRDPATA